MSVRRAAEWAGLIVALAAISVGGTLMFILALVGSLVLLQGMGSK